VGGNGDQFHQTCKKFRRNLRHKEKNVKNSSNAIKHTIRDDIHINWIQLHMRVKLQISNVATCFG